MRRTPVAMLAAATLTAATLAVAPAPAGAQLGTYAGCTLYACYEFALSEVARTGPLLPFPGSPPPEYPLNVPSYRVDYRMDVVARLLPQAVTDGVTTVSPMLPWFFNDGSFGDGGCCVAFGTFAVGGLAAGTELAWTSAGFPIPDMSGYVAVDAPPGTAGVRPGLAGIEFYELSADPFGGANDLAIAPVTTVVNPEPGTIGLVAGGLVVVAGVVRRRQSVGSRRSSR